MTSSTDAAKETAAKRMSLSNGYFKVTVSKNDQFQVVCKGPNHETLNQTEQLKTWEAVKTNILSAIRASNGRNAVVVDATLKNLEKKKLYYRIQESGDLKQIVVNHEEDAAVTVVDDSSKIGTIASSTIQREKQMKACLLNNPFTSSIKF